MTSVEDQGPELIRGRYIGGTTLIEDKGLLVNAAQIATVEARQVNPPPYGVGR
jgi:hypothetical protein